MRERKLPWLKFKKPLPCRDRPGHHGPQASGCSLMGHHPSPPPHTLLIAKGPFVPGFWVYPGLGSEEGAPAALSGTQNGKTTDHICYGNTWSSRKQFSPLDPTEPWEECFSPNPTPRSHTRDSVWGTPVTPVSLMLPYTQQVFRKCLVQL